MKLFFKKHPLSSFLIAIFIAALGVLVLAKPIYLKTKEWRAYYFLKQAKVFLDQEVLDKALYKANLAYQLNPKNLDIARFLAYNLSKYNRVEALNYWKILLDKAEMNEGYAADRQYFIQYCLNIDYVEAATPYVQELLSIEHPTLEEFLVLIRYWQNANQLDLALSTSENAHKTYPEHTLLQLTFAQLLLCQNDTSSHSRAFELLKGILAATDNKTNTSRINAYTLMVQHFELDPHFKTALLADPLFQDIRYHYTLASLKIRLYPSDRKKIIQDTLASTHCKTALDTLTLLQWLNQEGAFEEASTVIPEELALKDRLLIVPYLDALAGLKRWKALRDIILKDNLPIDGFLLSIFRTRLGLELDDSLLASSHWNHTLSLAKNHPDQLLFLANYFEKLGKLDFAWEAYKCLLENPNFALLSAKHMLAITRTHQNTRDALFVFRSLSRHFPKDLEPKIALMYTELLLRENITKNREKAREILNTYPEKAYTCHLLALAYLLNDQAQAAMAAYETYKPPLDHAPPSWKSVYAAVCFANHKLKEANAVLQGISIADLAPEEKALLEAYRPAVAP
jgi:predicted Zn-dependent protease